MSDSIQFWFSIGSTYTYLTVARLEGVAARTGIDFAWRPFSIRTITQEQNNSPFRGKPIKAAYMWRDIERRSAMYGIPANIPAPYPIANPISQIGSLSSVFAKVGALDMCTPPIAAGSLMGKSPAVNPIFPRR